jgi:hypothetical protein
MNTYIPEESVRVIARIRPPSDEHVIKLLKSPASEEYLKYLCLHPSDDVQTLRLSPNYLCICPSCISKYSMEVKIETFGALSKPTKHDKFFKFSRVFGWNTQQREVFEEVSSYVEAAVEGYNSSVISVGGTKSGKTYSLFGNQETSEGVIPLAICEVFRLIEEKKANDPNTVYEVEMSFVELNNNQFKNLLHEDNNDHHMTNNAHHGGIIPLSSISQALSSTDDYDEIRGVIKSLNHIDPNNPLHNSNKVEVKESSVLGVYLTGTNLKQRVSSPEEAYELLKRGERIRAGKSVNMDSSSSFK